MDSVELIRKICKERGIAISKLEKDCGFSNGYIRGLRRGILPSDRAMIVADYLGLSMESLLAGGDVTQVPEISPKDERDIAKDLDRIMNEIEKGEDSPLYYNGTEIDEASLGLLRNAIEYALRETKKENKVKYNPMKNKK